jgi:hypothetical protein
MSTMNFVLNAFDDSVTLTTTATLPKFSPTAVSADADIELTVNVPLDVIRNTFYYRTDDVISSDSAFVYHFVDMSAWSTFESDINPKNGTVVSNYYKANDAIGKDFLRDIAQQLFQTSLGVDLFTNEAAVIADIESKCDLIAAAISAKLSTVDQTNGSLGELAVDSTSAVVSRRSNLYMPDTSGDSNITRVLLNTLLDADTGKPSRFTTVSDDAVAGAAGYYHVPFVAGDELHFKVTINSSETQFQLGTASVLLDERSYKVRMIVAATTV